MVGAVIAKDGRIIGEGFHARFGERHAERRALASLVEPADGATLYVTLEPCCHTGHTPPCTQAIIDHRIGRVMFGSPDPNPLVDGNGASALRSHGIEVIGGVLRRECDAMNPVFFHYITTRTPYVRMKYAMTLDGKTATRTGASQWITGPAARECVHRLRHTSMAILVGIGTALADDPLLTCRIPGGRNPTRIVCDSGLSLPLHSRLAATARHTPVIDVCRSDIFTHRSSAANSHRQSESGLSADRACARREALEQAGVEVLPCPPDASGRPDLAQLMRMLGARGIDSVLIEGGGTLNASALDAGIVDEIDCFVAPEVFGASPHSPVGPLTSSATASAVPSPAASPASAVSPKRMATGVDVPSQAVRFQVAERIPLGDDTLLRCVRRR